MSRFSQNVDNVQSGNNMSEVEMRRTLYKGFTLLQTGDMYKNFDKTEKPLAATMGISDEKTLIETAFGLAQKDDVLQKPVIPTSQ
ncbi:hypothetical protein ABVT39_011124 [Epinephelus coioides]